MTNAELYDTTEKIAEQAIVLVRDCDGDRSKINDGLWAELVRLFKLVDDYI